MSDRPTDWLPGRVLYQLHSLGAAGAPAANPDVSAAEPCGRGLRVLSGWLDHVAGLGCGGVLLTPIFVSATHGYDTVDPFRIDQRLGDEADFEAFVSACHERDLRVVLDGVFNHVGRAFGPFRDVLERRASSPFAGWFRLDFDRDDGDGFAYRCFEGHRDLVALNHRSDAVLDWAASVASHWLDHGADGWRLDAAYAMPVPFLAALAGRIRSERPDAFVFGEVIHGDYVRFVTEGGLDSVTQYELHKAIWSSLNDANLFELAWALGRHRDFAARFAPVTFAGNHDVTRFASQLGDPGHLAAALAVLFTVPGRPCIYYGDELAWRGVKEHRAGGDDAIRPALPPDGAAPGDEGQAWALDLHGQLIALRRARPWLTDADIEVGDLANRRITYTVTAPDAGSLVVVIDLDAPTPEPPPGWHPIAADPHVTICEPA
jgi:cyclomaltodextrinase / maltogenic alpha-amylase / neopullulanase